MDGPIERRVADERHRIDLSQRLTAIETSQKLYHEEMKSILEMQQKELASVKSDLSQLRWTLYGGPTQNDVGLLEKFRQLLWKFGVATTIGFGCVTGGLKLFGPTLNKAASHMAGLDDITRYQEQQKTKRLQMYNRETGKYEYYIQFIPVQTDEGAKAKHP
jgi:hypothetical protein